jgi:hypothetical protein
MLGHQTLFYHSGTATIARRFKVPEQNVEYKKRKPGDKTKEDTEFKVGITT